MECNEILQPYLDEEMRLYIKWLRKTYPQQNTLDTVKPPLRSGVSSSYF